MAQPAIALANMAGIPPPNPLGANIAGAQGQGQAGHPQPLAQAPPHQLNVQPAPNPFVRCVKFLACWDCGPVGTIIAAAAFAAGTVISYYTFKLAIWTATKDYIEHCQSDEVASPAYMTTRNKANIMKGKPASDPSVSTSTQPRTGPTPFLQVQHYSKKYPLSSNSRWRSARSNRVYHTQ